MDGRPAEHVSDCNDLAGVLVELAGIEPAYLFERNTAVVAGASRMEVGYRAMGTHFREPYNRCPGGTAQF